MASYKITYSKTGGGVNDILDYVIIHTSDILKNGERINDIIGIINCFEEIAEEWGTYENRNAITKIELI